MKNIYFFSVLVIVINFFYCNDSKNQVLTNDILIKKYFNEKEIKDLEKILNFFTNEISNGCTSEIPECFQNFLKYAKEKYINKDLNISEENQDDLMNNISKSTINKIWGNSLSFKTNPKDTLSIVILKFDSDYMNFMNELGVKRPHIKKCHELFKNAGDISAALIVYIFENYDDFNLNDEKEKLILAIHYMSLNKVL